MKKNLFFLLATIIPFACFAQSNSWDGHQNNGISPHQGCRMLNIFVNIIYDVNPDANNVFTLTDWPAVTNPSLEGVNNAGIPNYLLDLADISYHADAQHGILTRLYGESSFNQLQLTGDFMVVNVRESRVLQNGAFDTHNIVEETIHIINENGGLQTLYGHNVLSDYTNFDPHKIAFCNILIRNITKVYGGLDQGSGKGFSTISGLLVEGEPVSSCAGTLQCVGSGNFAVNPTSIIIHEISHSLFGSNNFHTSGGNHRGNGCSMSFLNIQGGYGLMGAAGSGLVGCNGYERWRMHWKHPQSADYIAARKPENTQSVPSDIRREDGNQSFLLRDFVTYGDAIRIQLPYKDGETSSNQYIWLENHKVGSNGKLDFLQYSNTADCRPAGAAGIYAYYQVGRDVLSISDGVVWDSYDRDNLKVIPAEGYFDYELVRDTFQYACVSYQQQHLAVRRGEPNPLNGGQDQAYFLFPEEGDNQLVRSAEHCISRKIIGNETYDDLTFLGDNSDAFSSASKINMGTNPSTCNTATCHSKNQNEELSSPIHPLNSSKDTRTIYLSGLGIEMVPQPDGDFIVNIRWDDYDIANDVRWTGTIELKDTARLLPGNTITLAQNRTVSQCTRDEQTGLFASATSLTCKPGSYFHLDSSATLLLTENSTVILESNSKMVLEDGASVIVNASSALIVKDTACLNGTARIIVRPGGRLVIDGGVLTSACEEGMWQGIFVEGDRTLPQTPSNQGVVELKNGAVIENAICGISTRSRDDSLNTTGGIILADNATFRNCRRAVELLSYADLVGTGTIRANRSHFHNCTFTVDDGNRFAANNTDFYAHTTLNDVKSVQFKGCAFSNTATNTSRGRAIFSQDAGFSVCDFCNTPDNMLEPCECPFDFASHSTFHGFATAIEAGTSGRQYAVKVEGATFYDNTNGVLLNGCNFPTVTRCDFILQNTQQHGNYATGLRLNCCTGYLVEENDFYFNGSNSNANITGIRVVSSGTTDNSIRRNNFSGLNYAIYTQGTNGVFARPVTGLEFSCNTFTGNSEDIYVSTGSTIKPDQGNATMGADNAFHGTLSHSLYAPTAGYRYFHSSGLAPAGTHNFTVNANAAANDCESSLCDHDHAIPSDDPFAMSMADYGVVRRILSDTLESLDMLAAKYKDMNSLPTQYALAETQWQLGLDNTTTLQDLASKCISSEEEYNEFANYMVFNEMKMANWSAATESQRDELRHIAGKNSGRSSEMAKSILCFFFDECSEDSPEPDQAKGGKTTGYLPIIGTERKVYALLGVCVTYDHDTIYLSDSYTWPFILPSLEDSVTINGQTHYEEKSYQMAALREDTAAGRLYVYNPQIGEDVLLCDMSLTVGDTFYLPEMGRHSYHEAGRTLIVDSVDYINGRKYIYLSYHQIYEEIYNSFFNTPYFHYAFIEGIGPTYGPFGTYVTMFDDTYLPVLLCTYAAVPEAWGHFSTGEHLFSAFPEFGCFHNGLSKIDEHNAALLNIYPNPTGNILNLDFVDEQEPNGKITITDMAGMVVYVGSCSNAHTAIDVSKFSAGIYILRYEDAKGRASVSKFVKL